MISFVVPAHNEEACLGRTLEAIHKSARAVGQPYEIIVVDDASTDATADLARQNNARVLNVNHRQIAATRNSGARAAKGERLFFVDADTTINPRTLASAMQAMDQGAVGGGGASTVAKNEIVPVYIRLLLTLTAFIPKLLGFTGGAFMFCTREAFHATGGFNERLYWAEEGGFALALKREGRFFVPWQPVLTSGRRFRKTSGLQLLAGGVRMIFSPVRMVTERSSVEKIWYDSNRADDDKMPNSLEVKFSNAIALVVLLVMMTGPIFNFVPPSLTPSDSLIGQYRFYASLFLCHVGALGWLLGSILLVNLLRQKRWTGLVQSTVLIGLCYGQAWLSTHGVIRIWTGFGHWLAHLRGG